MGSQREFTKVRLKTREILTAFLVRWAIFFVGEQIAMMKNNSFF